jgi:hypothetical protein
VLVACRGWWTHQHSLLVHGAIKLHIEEAARPIVQHVLYDLGLFVGCFQIPQDGGPGSGVREVLQGVVVLRGEPSLGLNTFVIFQPAIIIDHRYTVILVGHRMFGCDGRRCGCFTLSGKRGEQKKDQKPGRPKDEIAVLAHFLCSYCLVSNSSASPCSKAFMVQKTHPDGECKRIRSRSIKLVQQEHA